MRQMVKSNYRVVVEPQRRFFGIQILDDDGVAGACAEIKEQIKRHVDGVGYIAVEHDTDFVCSFCGSTWTEGPHDPHNGGCCDADCANMPAEVES